MDLILVLYTSITVSLMLAGWGIVGITRHTLGRARNGGFVLIAVGTSFSSLSYTMWTGRFDGLVLLGSIISYGSIAWMYVREKLENNRV